ncbi:uncharacterized protein LOC110817136 [Carica papaya]|uniref:uncharacterized protein LOC110817136 n=1 Tax=Carica papaya TaxID=3649 RepID=UPI000B8CB435|nr:uncharacterized protein LOC110817136 [Carica papaya]XP_021901242.1 uncharacterized protein LOC110817136 [Carica papaya]XP_021901243.1 uncharacterized protein LOC110817136 [Carica papaya]
MIKTQFVTTIQVLRSNNACEYFESTLKNYLAENGIIHQNYCAYTPQQNGIAEKKNRHILEVARSIMFTSHVLKQFWGEALLTVTYLINKMSYRILQFQTHYELLSQFFSNSHILNFLPLEVFGCSAYIHVHSHLRGKLDPRAFKCIFVGYSSNQKGYKCFFLDISWFCNTVDVTFFENQSFYTKSDIQGEKVTQEYHLWDAIISLPIPVHSSPSQILFTQHEPKPKSVVGTKDTFLAVNELRIYTRRNKAQKGKPPEETELCYDSILFPTVQASLGNNASNPTTDDDLTIALRKNTRSCTNHPIQDYASFDNLFSEYHAFVSKLDNSP